MGNANAICFLNKSAKNTFKKLQCFIPEYE